MSDSHSFKMLVLLEKHIDLKEVETNSDAKYKTICIMKWVCLLHIVIDLFNMEGK